MVETYEEVVGIFQAMRARYGSNDKLTWENVAGAIDADDIGYVSPEATRDLKRRIGSASPGNG